MGCPEDSAKRLSKASYEETVCFTEPKTIAQYYMEDLRHEKLEHMKLLMLNSKAKLLGETTISKGTVNASLVTPRELFIEALQKNAVSIIILHNHPSGDCTPSRNDIAVTDRLIEGSGIFSIELCDHIIIGDNEYYSFYENKLI